LSHRTVALVMVAVLPAAVSWSDGVPVQSAPASGSIQGIVFDSLVASAPLPGAEVTIDGTELAVLTDRNGRFRFDSLPAGRTALRFYHARLDSLGFGVAPVSVDVAEGKTTQTRLATPSPATFYARLCAGARPPSSGVLLGVVRDVDDRRPLPTADVEVAWAEWTVGKSGMVRNERREHATTNANGAYALCGVPADVPVVARATSAGHITGLVEIDFAQRIFNVRDFAVSLADSDATPAFLARLDSLAARGDSVASRGSASLRGVIRAPDGRVLPEAQAALLGFPISVRSNSDGIYTITNVPAGSQTLEVRALGYAPTRLTIDLATGAGRTADVTVTRVAQQLATVAIVGKGSRLDNTGFETRRKGGLGYYMGPEELERRVAFDATQLFWGVPGTRLVWTGSRNVLVFARSFMSGNSGGEYSDYCSPVVFVDGFETPEIDDVRPPTIRAIEVYRNPQTAPPLYRTGHTPCGVILIWTKPPEPKLKR